MTWTPDFRVSERDLKLAQRIGIKQKTLADLLGLSHPCVHRARKHYNIELPAVNNDPETDLRVGLVKELQGLSDKERVEHLVDMVVEILTPIDSPFVDWKLSPLEFKLINALNNNEGKYIAFESLLRAIYPYENDRPNGARKVLDARICSLRKRLKYKPYCIDTQRGVGYRLTRRPPQR